MRVQLTEGLQPPLLHAAVECRITLSRHFDTLIIPRAALLSSAADNGTVMLAMDGRARRWSIQMRVRTATEVEVTDGLAAGDLVITHGQYALPDGAAITFTRADVSGNAGEGE